jgi:alanine dehydrogenase
MKRSGTILLTRSDVTALLNFDQYFEVIENAFRLHAEAKASKPGLMHIESGKGEFHVKAGTLELDSRFFGIKVNGGFFTNQERFGMPNIQGAILLCDGENGYPLAAMDSGEITMKRTGAAAAVAAKYLARPESSTVTICGCGVQGRVQLQAMKSIFPLRKAYAFDVNRERAELFAAEMSTKLRIAVQATAQLGRETMASDIWVTCTPSRRYYLTGEHVAPGSFVAAMGADSPEKQELDPELLKRNRVVVDVLDQCLYVGELHHAIDSGMKVDEVDAELCQIVSGRKPGRREKEEIIVFDATGTAFQDVAAAVAVYEQALRTGRGQAFDFFS